MENFYITLPSTASCDIYPNTQSHFRVQLPQPIELEGKWKVGLSEIHLPIAYDNIDAKTDLFHIHVSEKETENRNVTIQIPSFKFFGTVIEAYRSLIHHIITSIPEDLHTTVSFQLHETKNFIQCILNVSLSYLVTLSDEIMILLNIRRVKSEYVFLQIPLNDTPSAMIHNGENLWIKVDYPNTVKTTVHSLNIPHGLYVKTNHVMQAMIDVIPNDYKQSVKFRENRDGTITISCQENIRLEFPSNNHGLGSLLGFKDYKSVLPTTIKGDYSVDLKRGVYGLYVYSDLIQPHVVGDTFSPLLRVIPIQDGDKYTSSYVKIYTSPDYYDIMQNRFETIEIDIRSDFGQRLKFRNGKTLVKLAFQKV